MLTNLSNWDISGTGRTYDSSLISYNADGTIFSIVEKHDENTGNLYDFTEYVTVLTYNSLKQIAKIYTKINGGTQAFYYIPVGITSYKKNYYQPANDSLLAKVELYQFVRRWQSRLRLQCRQPAHKMLLSQYIAANRLY